MKLLAAIATLAAGIGGWFYRQREKKGLRVDKRYRGQAKRAMDLLERKTGLRFRHENIRLITPIGTRYERGLWMRWVADPPGHDPGYYAGFWQGSGHCVAVLDPQGNVHDGVLEHEFGHELYDQNRIPIAEHHARMRRDGVFMG